jgi:hypothetical protein
MDECVFELQVNVHNFVTSSDREWYVLSEVGSRDPEDNETSNNLPPLLLDSWSGSCPAISFSGPSEP